MRKNPERAVRSHEFLQESGAGDFAGGQDVAAVVSATIEDTGGEINA